MIGDGSRFSKREEFARTHALESAGLKDMPRYMDRSYRIMKGLFDRGLAAVALLILFPVFLIISVMIMIADGFPVIFKQRRLGENNQEFYIYKFRTMRRDAEQILKSNPALMEEYKRTFKIENDPRLLKFGKFLRSTSLDELPQLINVVQGKMSLVGPRPIVPQEIEKYGENQNVYLAMKPGCAGLWQCSGRSDLSYEERVALDVEYFRSARMRIDLMILWKTVKSVLKREGAR